MAEREVRSIAYQTKENYARVKVPSLAISGWFDADFPGTLEGLERVLVLDPRSTMGLVSLTHVRLMLGDTEGALEAAQRMTGALPDDPAGIAAHAHVLRQTGQLAESDALVEEAIGRGVVDSGLAVAWSQVCEGRGDLEGSLGVLERVALDESTPPPSRGAAMFRLGAGYSFHLNERWSISPEAQIDFVEGGTTVYVLAVAIGIGF